MNLITALIEKIIPRGTTRGKISYFYYTHLHREIKEKLTLLQPKIEGNVIYFNYLNEKLKVSFGNKFHDIVRFLLYFVWDEFPSYLREYIPKKGDIVIDAGSHMGSFTFYLSHLVGKEGRVYSFEPEERCYQSMENLIRLNKLENVTLLKKGIFNKKGRMFFYGDGSSGSFVPGKNILRSKKLEVIDVDTFLKERRISCIHYLKSDIESAEIELLEGARQALKNKKIKNMAIASYHFRGGVRTYTACEKLLRMHKYKFHTVFNVSTTPFVTYAHI